MYYLLEEKLPADAVVLESEIDMDKLFPLPLSKEIIAVDTDEIGILKQFKRKFLSLEAGY